MSGAIFEERAVLQASPWAQRFVYRTGNQFPVGMYRDARYETEYPVVLKSRFGLSVQGLPADLRFITLQQISAEAIKRVPVLKGIGANACV